MVSQADFGFGIAKIVSPDHFYVSGVLRSDVADGVDRSITFGYRQTKWRSWILDSRIVGMTLGGTTASPEVAHVTALGEVFSILGERLETSQIGDGVVMPSIYRQMTSLERIGRYLVAAGMRRMVFRRPLEGGIWSPHDRGALIEVGAAEINGFNAVGGISDEELYAVGFEGHLWACWNGTWRQIHIPTNVKLSCIGRAPEACMVVGGAFGVLLMGRGERWTIVEQDLTQDTFLSVASLGSRAYLTTDKGGVYFLEDGELFKDEAATTGAPRLYHVDAAMGCAIAVGSSSIRLLIEDTWLDIQLGAA